MNETMPKGPDSNIRATDTLANERTFLAYIRTALAFIAFGFVIARFSLFSREVAGLMHEVQPAKSSSTALGAAMVLFGMLVAILGAVRYAVTDRGLRRGDVVALSSLAGYAISIFVAVVGIVVAIVLLSYQ